MGGQVWSQEAWGESTDKMSQETVWIKQIVSKVKETI